MSLEAGTRALESARFVESGTARPSLCPVPRPLRPNAPGCIYHVTARGNRRQPIFLEDGDRHRFLGLLEEVARRYGWSCHAYCLMPNHYHLVLETVNADLSVGMHRLNSTYAHWFNARHALDGHVFQARFHSVLVESEWHLLELSRYVVLNPVRAGLCASPASWPWSSYQSILGQAQPAPFLAVQRVLGYFGSDPQSAQGGFRRFVRDAQKRTSSA